MRSRLRSFCSAHFVPVRNAHLLRLLEWLAVVSYYAGRDDMKLFCAIFCPILTVSLHACNRLLLHGGCLVLLATSILFHEEDGTMPPSECSGNR